MKCPGCGAVLDDAYAMDTACRWVGRMVDHRLREGLYCVPTGTFYLDHPRA
jgi:hypothetical protein